MIYIDKYNISEKTPAYIIAEVGVNHNGNMKNAMELIKVAQKCGVNCVKFQTFRAEQIVIQSAPKADYQLRSTNPQETQLDMLKKLELSNDDYNKLFEFCNQLGITFISTPYSEEDVDFLDELGVPAFKLASISVVEPQFIEYVALKKKPVILSTGMADLEEVREAVKVFDSTGNKDLILLQCTTNYPSEYEDCNIRAMVTMKNKFNKIIGYSDHTRDDFACITSIALGAKVIEKHLTLDRGLPGPDHSSSLNPDEFLQLVNNIRKTEIILGSDMKYPSNVEKQNAKGMRRSIVAKCNIEEGMVIRKNMLTLKRPASGLAPQYYKQLLGQKAKRKIYKDELINKSDIKIV